RRLSDPFTARVEVPPTQAPRVPQTALFALIVADRVPDIHTATHITTRLGRVAEYWGAMTEESTTPDLVELMRLRVDAVDRGDVDAMTSFFAPDAIWDSTPMGLEVYEGQAAIHRFFEDWWGSYEESEVEAEELLDLGSGVTFALLVFNARPAGSGGIVRFRYAAVTVWVVGAVAGDAN